jgi:hypothetical protein
MGRCGPLTKVSKVIFAKFYWNNRADSRGIEAKKNKIIEIGYYINSKYVTGKTGVVQNLKEVIKRNIC